MKSRLPFFARGFTLIELLVAVGLSLLLTSGVVVNYNSFNDSQRVQQAGATLKSTLRFIQNKAQTGEKPDAGCTRLTSYRMTFTATSYSYQAICAPEGEVGTPVVTNFANDVRFVAVPQSVDFYPLNSGASPEQTMVLRSQLGKTYTLSMYTSGVIAEGALVPTETPVPTASGVGDGLTGSYYDNQDFTNLVATQVDPQGNGYWSNIVVKKVTYSDRFAAQWKANLPASGLASNQYWSVDWQGYVLAPITGSVAFSAGSLGCGTVKSITVDGLLLYQSGTSAGSIYLTKGKKYPIDYKYVQTKPPKNNPKCGMYLQWSYKGQKTTPIPITNLFSS